MSKGLHIPFDDDLPSESSTRDGWPELTEIGPGLSPIEKFDSRLLPASFRPLVEDISERMQTPADFAATALVVALAGCVNRRAIIRPKRQDYSWEVIPNLWGAVIAPPGYMKSPVMHYATAPLVKIESLWRAEYESAQANYQCKLEEAEIGRQAWRELYKASLKKGGEGPLRPDDAVAKEPSQRRLLLTDSTFERLHEILKDNPAGILVLRDELTGWLADLDKQGRESERSFHLQAWNGDSPFTVDRIGRGSIYVPAVCVSLLGNIQPSRLRTYLQDALFDGPANDGLFQRFQILVWPDTDPSWSLVDRPPDEKALYLAENIMAKLVELSEAEPVRLRFSDAAQQLFFDWWAGLEFAIRGGCNLHPAMVAHLAKYRSLLPTLAGLFELADTVADGTGLGSDVSISLDHTRAAAAYCDYLRSHAQRVYGCFASVEVGAAQELCRHIKAGDLPDPFNTRELYRHHWRDLDMPERVRPALELLTECGWVRPMELGSKNGRPSELWVINPKVVNQDGK